MERTFILAKPDTIQRGLLGEVVSRFEKKGLKIVGLKMIQLDNKILETHYSHLVDKPFFGGIKDFMKSSPVVAMCLEGKECVNVVRSLCGITNSREANPGTLRGDYSLSIQCNVVHASDSLESAKEEIDRFFDPEELFDYKMNNLDFILSPDEQ